MYNLEEEKLLDTNPPKEINPTLQKRPLSKSVEQKVRSNDNAGEKKTVGTSHILLKTILETLYHIKYQDEDLDLHLELEINFKEFELILLQLSHLVGYIVALPRSLQFDGIICF